MLLNPYECRCESYSLSASFHYTTIISIRMLANLYKRLTITTNALLLIRMACNCLLLRICCEYAFLKSLSHQGGVLTVIPPRPKNAERRGARSMNASITAATQWHRQWTQLDRIERRATPRTLSILKTRVFL